jgi:hypothetical protein
MAAGRIHTVPKSDTRGGGENGSIGAGSGLSHILAEKEIDMPRFLIERRIPEAGRLTGQQLQAISQTSAGVLNEMGPRIQWVQSFVTDDAIYCTYIAADAELVREHARRGGFPADRVIEVRTVIDPTTAE